MFKFIKKKKMSCILTVGKDLRGQTRLKDCMHILLRASATCGGVAGAGGHRGRLQDDGVAAGGQSNRHLLVQDPTWSLRDFQGWFYVE